MPWYKWIGYNRFVLPVLPFMFMFSGHNLAAMAQLKGKGHNEKGRLSRLKLSVILLILTNVPMALYMSLYHQVSTTLSKHVLYVCVFWVNLVAFYLCLVNFSFQDSFTSVMCMCTFSLCQRGTEDAMLYLSREAHDGRVKSVLFLMPCHSTPYYSTLHYNLPMRFLDCTPRWLFFHCF